MKHALRQAELALSLDEVPVGAVMVLDQQIIARSHNQVQRLCDPTAHAEILCITAACNYLGSKYLPDCSLYVSLEPCLMCAGAIGWAQIKEVVFAAYDPRKGFSLYHNVLPSKTLVTGGILEHDASTMLKGFFAAKRN